MFNKNQFGERLRILRKRANENQGDLAAILDVTITQISDMETGKRSTTLEKFALICEHYQVSADYLLGLIDDPRPLNLEKMEEKEGKA